MKTEEYFVDEDPSYLTLARFEKQAWGEWLTKNGDAYHRMTGFEQIHSKNAFQAGFFAGFEARFFKQND